MSLFIQVVLTLVIIVVSATLSIFFGIVIHKNVTTHSFIVGPIASAVFYWSLLILFFQLTPRRVNEMADKVRFLQYKVSRGCKALVEALREGGVNALRLKVRGSTYPGYRSHLIVNWGSSERRSIQDSIEIFNDPTCVAIAGDKLKTFEALPRDLCPDYTTSADEAEEWISQGYRVYCRTLLQSREGRGIVVAREMSDIVDAPLYTKGLDVSRELRVHVWDGEVIDYVQKKRMGSERREEGGIEVDEDIRNHDRGWVFARSGVTISDEVSAVAVEAVQSLGLDFGAVDLVVTEQDTTKVLEINTAPGITGTTLEKYKDAVLHSMEG